MENADLARRAQSKPESSILQRGSCAQIICQLSAVTVDDCAGIF